MAEGIAVAEGIGRTFGAKPICPSVSDGFVQMHIEGKKCRTMRIGCVFNVDIS